jgi:hypothetical protein
MNATATQPTREGPLPRIAAIALLAGALTRLILSVSAADAQPAAGANVVALEQGKPIEREILNGETHVYEVVVPEDRVVSGVVDQRGIDLVVRVIDPTGATVATVDSPNGTAGPEPWTLAPRGKTAGTWRLEVSPLVATSGSGRYEARVDEIITSE